jgi:hypothetical protein
MIIRRKVNRNFTTIPNDPIVDERLSFEALGLLTYLLSRPDNWRVCVEQLKTRGSIGRDKAYRLLTDLMHLGYIIRRQVRDAKSKQFGVYEYIVYDEPQKALEEDKPLPENPETAKTAKTEPLPEKPLPAEPYPANQEHNKDCKITNSLREHSASAEAGADAPQRALENEGISPPEPYLEPSESLSVSSMVWKEALELLSSPHTPEPRLRRVIGKWLKQATSDEAKQKLRAILGAARRAGTHDPIAYISKALNEAYPPAPSPEEFDFPKWTAVGVIAIRTGHWAKEWGKPPGKKGCLMPADLITPDLLNALVQGARAA